MRLDSLTNPSYSELTNIYKRETAIYFYKFLYNSVDFCELLIDYM
jgi:hypothetical protein